VIRAAYGPAPSTVVPPLQVFPVATKKAIHSFPNGSAGGLDGLMPHHLKGLLLGAPDDHPLLLAITDLVNLQLKSSTWCTSSTVDQPEPHNMVVPYSLNG